jgi:TonB family protein
MFASLLLHVLIVILVILLSPVRIENAPSRTQDQTPRNRIFLQPVPAPSKGGGGSQSPLAPSRGQLPRYALRQFTPPVVTPENPHPKLAMEPTIVLDVKFASLPDGPIGLPNGSLGPPSGGPGRRGGIGDGYEGGIGDDAGPGIEGSRAERLHAGMKPPVALIRTEPEYSEQARVARLQGTVVVEGIIDERGHTADLRVRQPLGLGLDEKAIEAVKMWRFRPATRDGKPLAITAIFELNFRLL